MFNLWHTLIMKVAIYARVSTADQDCAMQLTELREYAGRMKWPAPLEYIEKASGKRGSKRPVLASLLADARQRKFDVLLIWKLDRFGRSVMDLAHNFEILDQCGVRVLIPSQSVDTDNKSPMGKFIIGLFSLIAEFERSIIVERVRSGVAQYKEDYDAGRIGKTKHSKSGKDLAPHRPKRIFNRQRIADMRAAGRSWNEIVAETGLPKTTVRRALEDV